MTADILSGGYSGGGDSGTFFLAYESEVSERVSPLENLSATWTTTDSLGFTLTMNVGSDGQIIGSDTNGCMYNGNSSVLAPSFNIYRLDITVTSCTERSGSYAGLATIINKDDLPQVRCLACNGLLILVISNADSSITAALEK